MEEPARVVLLIEADPGRARLVNEAVAGIPGAPLSLRVVGSLSAARQLVSSGQLDAVLLGEPKRDAGESGKLETLCELVHSRPELPVVVLTGSADEIIAALRHGALECLDSQRPDTELVYNAVRRARERCLLLAELRRKEQQSRAILRALPDMAFQINAGGTFTAYKGQNGAPLLMQPDQFLGRSFTELLPGEVAALVEQHMAEARRSGELQCFEYQLEIDRSIHWFEARLTECGEDGFLVVVRDISERKEAQEGLRERERHYRLLFERNLAGVFRTTPEGLFLEANDALARVFGFSSRDELMSATVWDMYESPAARQQLLDRVEREGTVHNHEQRLRRHDGEPIWVLINLSLVHDEQRRRVLEGTLIDITARKRMEEQLLRVQKMQVVGQLAGGIAHDFNNLLQAMQSGLEVLRVCTSEERRASATDELENHITRGAALTRKLLLFARRELAQRRRLDLNAVIRETVQMLRRLVRENIRVIPSLSDGPLPVEADPGQLEQILVNLTINASEAMPEGGRLIVHTWQESGMAVCEVTDTGVGIPEGVRDRVFDPFYTTKPPDKGAGLGLAMVHSIVTELGGTIDLESEVQRGSTFRFSLPLHTDEPQPSPPQAWDEERAGGRVLLVEDEIGAREGLKDILDLLGYNPTAVGSGEEALALPVSPGFDVLLTDLVLPGIQGCEVAERLSKRWPGIKIILMSGYTEDETIREKVWSGALRFLHKPFGAKDLAAELRSIMEPEG